MKKDEVLAKLRELKPAYAKEGFVIVGLFGSFAKGTDDENSDIDIAIKIDDDYLVKNDVWAYFDTINAIRQDVFMQLGRKSDILDIQSSSHIKAKIEREMIYV
jgi:uncharacterized protein